MFLSFPSRAKGRIGPTDSGVLDSASTQQESEQSIQARRGGRVRGELSPLHTPSPLDQPWSQKDQLGLLLPCVACGNCAQVTPTVCLELGIQKLV